MWQNIHKGKSLIVELFCSGDLPELEPDFMTFLFAQLFDSGLCASSSSNGEDKN